MNHINDITKGNHDYLHELITQPYDPENQVLNALKAAYVELANHANIGIAEFCEQTTQNEFITGDHLIKIIIGSLRKVADDWQASHEVLSGAMKHEE